MAEIPMTNNRTKRVSKKKEPKYNSINEIPISEIINNTQIKAETPSEEDIVNEEIQTVETVKKNNVIQINDVSKILNLNNGSGYYKIKFPSLGKSLNFKQITIGQQRSLSKHSSSFNNRAEQMRLRCSILKSACLDESFDPTEINWAEFINALLVVRNSNFFDDLTYNVKCDNESCQAESFPFTVNLIKLNEHVENIIESVNNMDKTFKFKINGKEVCFELDFPKMKDYIVLAEQYSNLKETENDDDIDAGLFLYPYIRSISIENTPVDISSVKGNIVEFKNFIDETFIGMSFKKFAEAVANIFDKFSNEISIFEAKCPVCGTTKSLTFDIDDFFAL